MHMYAHLKKVRTKTDHLKMISAGRAVQNGRGRVKRTSGFTLTLLHCLIWHGEQCSALCLMLRWVSGCRAA